MSFGGADNPFGGLELTAQGGGPPEQPERPLDEIAAEHDASLAAVQAEHGEAMDEEARRQQIGEAVFAMATDGGAGEEHLGEYIEHEIFPDRMNQCLYDAECNRRQNDPEYDITTENPRTIAGFLAFGLHREYRHEDRTDEELVEIAETVAAEATADSAEGTAEDTVETADTTETTADAYQELVAELRAEGKTTVQIINELANHPAVPDAEKANLRGFQRLLAISQRFPDEAPLVAQRINTLDMSQGVPSPAQFIQTVIFSSPDFDSGFSQEFQTAVATEFNLTPHRPEQPRNANELQTALREGSGTREIVEVRRIEEPPGSGNWVEQEVVVGEEVIPFSPEDKLVLSEVPLVTIHPVREGGEAHRVEGHVAGSDPIGFEVDIPETGALPVGEIHRQMNKQLLDTTFSNAGLNGAMEYLTTGQDAALGTSNDTSAGAIGQADVLQNMMHAFSGYTMDINSRFLTGDELQDITPNLRWFAVDGDFGAANQNDPSQTIRLMQALFGGSQSEINANLHRANSIIDAGLPETPSYQALYARMYPEDVANGYVRLREIVGDEGMARLRFKH